MVAGVVCLVLIVALLAGPAAAGTRVALAQGPEDGAGGAVTSEALSMFLQIFLQAVLVPALVALTVAGVRWLASKAQEAKAGVPAELLYAIEQIAKMAVMAAEQSGLSGQIGAEGKAKKAWAMNWAEQVLKTQFGLILDLDRLGAAWWDGVRVSLDGAIEATVAESLNSDRLAAPESRGMAGD